jgi:hypothetical protein
MWREQKEPNVDSVEVKDVVPKPVVDDISEITDAKEVKKKEKKAK